jgi:hypothetical protein
MKMYHCKTCLWEVELEEVHEKAFREQFLIILPSAKILTFSLRL